MRRGESASYHRVTVQSASWVRGICGARADRAVTGEDNIENIRQGNRVRGGSSAGAMHGVGAEPKGGSERGDINAAVVAGAE